MTQSSEGHREGDHTADGDTERGFEALAKIWLFKKCNTWIERLNTVQMPVSPDRRIDSEQSQAKSQRKFQKSTNRYRIMQKYTEPGMAEGSFGHAEQQPEGP